MTDALAADLLQLLIFEEQKARVPLRYRAVYPADTVSMIASGSTERSATLKILSI